jgi:hypothetical protein
MDLLSLDQPQTLPTAYLPVHARYPAGSQTGLTFRFVMIPFLVWPRSGNIVEGASTCDWFGPVANAEILFARPHPAMVRE